jgi:hypothetical protein
MHLFLLVVAPLLALYAVGIVYMLATEHRVAARVGVSHPSTAADRRAMARRTTRRYS